MAVLRVVPKHELEEKSQQTLDLRGAALVTSSLIIQVLAFSMAPRWGWLNGSTLGLIGLSVVLMGGFLFNEAKIAKHPLMPLSILGNRNVVGANAMMAAMYATMLGMFFIITLYVQNVLHYSPVKAGLSFLPFPVIIGIISSVIPKLVGRYGYKRFLVIGPSLVGLAMIWLSRLPADGSYVFNLLPAMIVIPLGVGLTFMPIIVAATSGVSPEKSGLASGLITTSQQMGGALGLAILSSVAASATAAATHASGDVALVRGFDRAIGVSVVFMVIAISVAVIVIRKPNRSPSQGTPARLADTAELSL